MTEANHLKLHQAI